MKRGPKPRRWIAAAFLVGMILGPGIGLGDGPKKLDGGAVQGEIVLAENGTSPFAIVTAGDAPAPVKFAAEELQKYVAAVTGARLPIKSDPGPAPAICVGQSKALADEADRLKSDLRARGEDGYLVRAQPKRIVLLGNSPRATVYAVYHFLEKCLGCGWCAPGDDTVPHRPTAGIPPIDDRVGPPALAMRQIILYPYGGQWLKKNNVPHTDWLAKNRFNWAHPAPNGPYSWERNPSRQVFIPEVEKRGLYLEVGGHTFSTWIPPDRYAKDHPDFFAVNEDGGRAVEANEKAGLCLSHPEVARQVAANMTAWLDANPEVDAIDLWHNDSWTSCRCPKCSPKQPQETDIRLAYTRTYIRFVNQVAALVAQKHPKVLINLLSYAHTTNAPPDAEPLGSNVLVGLCLFPRPSQRTMRPLETSPQKLDSNLRLQIPAWQRLAKHFYIYEYYTFSDKQRVWSMVSMMCDDMRYFRRLGVDGISSDQWGPGWYPLNMVAFGKLAWNPDLTPQEIVDDFCARYYGRAAQAMAAYWNTLEKCLRESWNTDRPIDWRDQERAALIRQALSLAESKSTADRIRSTAALHGLRLDP